MVRKKMLALLLLLAVSVQYLEAEVQPSINRGSILYIHGEEDKDRLPLDKTTEVAADSAKRLDLNFKLTFFGHRFDYINIANNGYLFFADYLKTDFNYGPFPVSGYPFQDDVPMIAPYYARVDINQNDDRQMVYYRQMKRDLTVDDPGSDPLDDKVIQRRDNHVLEDAERCIHRAVVGGDLFFAKFGAIATWRNLTYAGVKRPQFGRDETNKKNTFQALIVTDENETYAIFNYDEIQWAADETMNLDTGIFARIGFNRGNGTRWAGYDRFSGLEKVEKIDEDSNSDILGRYIFRIDGIYDSIKVGGCNNDSSGSLQAFPNFGGMFGGEQMNVSGPCFQPFDKIECKYHDVIVPGKYISLQRIRCVSPFLLRIGVVKLSVSVNGSPFENWQTDYTIVTPDRCDHSLELKDPYGWSKMPPPDTLGIMWDRLFFAQETYSEVDVLLYGYREDPDNEDPDLRIQTRLLAKLGENEDNDGVFEFRTFDVRKRPGSHYQDIEQFEMGAIAVVITGNTNISMWSPLLALGWWNHWDLKEKYGEVWAMERCKEWYYEDIKQSDWRKDIDPCPCRMSQAVKDIGRFMADPECDYRKQPNTCVYSSGAHHCVRSIFATPSGASSHCCYNGQGELMYTQDTHRAGGANRAHMWGQCPYAKPYMVPALSRFFHDVLPFHYCCIWTNYAYETWYDYKFYFPCKWYLEQRNTTGCDRYEPPGPAYVFGDPHFRTFNDSKYTFNGKGEYRLLESMDFKMHGFFEQAENNSYGQVNATRLTAVAMQEGTGTKVEIRVNLPSCRWRNRLQVLVNGNDVQFNSTMNKWQWFEGGSANFTGDVSVFDRDEDVGTKNVTVMFPSGTGIQAVEANGVLNVFVSASPRFYKQTYGLFGYWDRWSDNDLMLPGKNFPNDFISTTGHENLYKSYGIMWKLADTESPVLTHPIGRNFSFTDKTYNLREFFPIFGTPPVPKNANYTEEEGRKLCVKDGLSQEVNEECLYDFLATANRDIALNTKKQEEYWRHLYEGIKPYNSCGVLPVRGDWEGADRYPNSYMADTGVKVNCKKGYNFYGQASWHCNREGDWEGASWGRDEEWPMCLSVRHTAEYSGIVGGPVLFGVILLGVVLLFLRKKKKQGYKRKNPYVVTDMESGSTKELRRMDEKESSGRGSTGAMSSISGSLAPRSSSEGISNRGVDSTPSTTPGHTPSNTLKKGGVKTRVHPGSKGEGGEDYAETDGL